MVFFCFFGGPRALGLGSGFLGRLKKPRVFFCCHPPTLPLPPPPPPPPKIRAHFPRQKKLFPVPRLCVHKSFLGPKHVSPPLPPSLVGPPPPHKVGFWAGVTVFLFTAVLGMFLCWPSSPPKNNKQPPPPRRVPTPKCFLFVVGVGGPYKSSPAWSGPVFFCDFPPSQKCPPSPGFV